MCYNFFEGENMKLKKTIINFITLFFITLLIISASNILKYYNDSKNTNKQIKKINKIAKIDKSAYNFNINFNKLTKINKNIKGWIRVNGTNINYPFVQTTDNDYYLKHSIDDSYNTAGWVFLDYRNNLNPIKQKNTILYAHGRVDKTMFGSLRDTLYTKWFKNKDNHIISLYTKSEKTLWQVFSIYHIPTKSDYLQTEFKNNEEFKDLSKILIDRSIYNFNIKIDDEDKILTLSTCYNKNEKIVLHAKLIEEIKKEEN